MITTARTEATAKKKLSSTKHKDNMKDLIVVDMQKGFINEKNEFLVEKINSLLKNNRFNCVYYTRFRNHSECPFKTLLNYDGMMGKDTQEIIVSRKNNSCVLHKSSYGLDPNDIDFLKQKMLKKFIFAEQMLMRAFWQLHSNFSTAELNQLLFGTQLGAVRKQILKKV